MFTLVVEDDQGRKTEVPFAAPGLSIGRDKDNNVRLNERNVSRKHAKLSTGNGGIFIEDLGSYNGVKINGDRIQGKAPIFLGDRIQLGDFLLQVMGESLRPRPEEITQKTHLPKGKGSGEEITNTEPMIVAPVGSTPPQALPARPPPNGNGQSPATGNGHDQSFDESTALIRLNDVNQKSPSAPTQVVTGPHPKLVCTKGPMAGREWPMNKGELVIGRGAENDIQIDHRSMSRQHAKLVLAGQTWRIVDAGSANGTLVNGEQYAQVDLKRGDVIELGHVKLRVVWPGDPTPKIDAPSDNAFDESTTISQRASARRTQEVDAHKSNKPLWMAIAAGVGVAITGIVAWVAMAPEPPPAVHTPPAAAQPQVAPHAPTPAPPVATPTPPAPGVDVAEVLRRANIEMASENWDGALRILDVALKEAPTNEPLRSAQEKAELERGAKATYDAGMSAYQRGDFVTAKELFLQIGEQSSYYQRAIKRIGEPKVRNAQPRPAPKTNTPKAPKAEKVPTTTAEEKVEKPEPKPAPTPDPAPAAETPRDRAKKLNEQGNQALKQNKVREAIELFVEATKMDPKYAPPHRGLGIAHARAGNGEAAVEHYRIYLQLYPSAPEADQVKKIIQEYESAGD